MASLVGGLRGTLTERGYQHHARLLSAFDRDAINPPVDDPVDLPVLGALPAAALAAAEVDPSIAHPVRLLSPSAPWTQTRAYVREPPDGRFLGGYAHATLAGTPDGENQAVGSGISVGLVLLDAGIHYPPHQHPADEVYVPLGAAQWLDSTDGRYRPRAAGVPIHHVPWQPHAVRTATQPLLAVYLWSGDVATPSRWCAPDAARNEDRS